MLNGDNMNDAHGSLAAREVNSFLRKYGHLRIVPSPALMRYWYKRLNRSIFHGELPGCRMTVREDFGASTLGAFYPDEITGHRINLEPVHTWSTSDVVETIAHEMIHQLQEIRGKKLWHGGFFKTEARRVSALLGIDV